MVRFIRLSIALAVLALLAGCSRLTVENYGKIKPGRSYPEIVALLGKPDSCSEALFMKNCVWGDEQRNITINFVGDKVILFSSKNIK